MGRFQEGVRCFVNAGMGDGVASVANGEWRVARHVLGLGKGLCRKPSTTKPGRKDKKGVQLLRFGVGAGLGR